MSEEKSVSAGSLFHTLMTRAQFVITDVLIVTVIIFLCCSA